MSGPQPYAPGGTGTLADVLEQGPELRGVRPAGPDSFAPPAPFGDLVHAYRVQNRAYRTDFDEIMLRDGYSPIVDALGLGQSQNPAAFFDNSQAHEPVLMRSDLAARSSGFMGSMIDRPRQEELLAGEIRARRALRPDFLPGVPDTVDGLHQYFRDQEAKQRQAAGTTIGRGSGGLSQAFAGLAGGGIESFHDPVNLLTLPIGGGGKTLVGVVAREALLNGVLEAAQLPLAAHNLGELGEEMTVGGAVGDVVSAGVFGGLLGGSFHLAGEHVPPALFKVMPESVQRRWADKMKVGGGKDAPLLKDVLGDMDNRELAGFARSTIGEKMTPDERAAADTLEREQELGEASPFMPGPAGDGAHQQSLAGALQSIIDGAPRPAPTRGDFLSSSSLNPAAVARPIDVGRASVPSDIVDFFKAKGLDDAHAYGIAAGIVAESGGNHRVINPTSGAAFLGQWLGSRKAALIERYGPNPSRAQQLEFLWHELNGGDPGGKHVLGAKDAGSVLDAYIRKFMRPAAGAETLGDLDRGMAALGGRKGELPEGSAAGDVAGDDDLVAALRREAEQADDEALALSRDEADGDLGADLGRAAPTSADVPILKRELFDSDADWADAQLAFYRSQGLAGGPLERESGGAAPEVASTPEGAEIPPGESAGPFGREFPEAAGDWQATLAALRGEQGGVVPGALDHPEIGKIDLTWGEAGTNRQDGYGLAKLEKYHPEVIADLPEIVRSMSIRKRESGRIQLEGPNHRGAVRLDWDGENRTWLLTAFAKDPDRLPKGAPPLPEDRRGSNGGRDGSPDRGVTANISEGGPIDNEALKAFDDPAGRGAADQVASLEHDLRMAAAEPAAAKRTYDLGDGKSRTLLDILEELDRERDAIAALRACAGGEA